ncbi:MAG: alpha/beta fold hydrolase [Advenella sp.]|uniref:alpha/beta fold hydrolase n=1 Tax=Advenella sp. TaxID=1872388 RepID=UPI003F9E3772
MYQGTAKAVESINAGATNVVLVHGGTTDGSGWKAVHDILRAKGLAVTVVELPHTSLEEDIAATRLAVDVQSGPTVLVGHSYGGAVITEAGVAPNVKALVYVAALQPDKGETLAEISSRFPMGIDMKMVGDKRFVPNPATYNDILGGDLPRDVTDFMAASAKPMRVGKAMESATYTVRSYGLVRLMTQLTHARSYTELVAQTQARGFLLKQSQPPKTI